MRQNEWCHGHLGGYIHGGDPFTWEPAIWEALLREFGVRSVLDLGCGEGHSTKWFAEHACDVLGIEGWEKPIREGVWPETILHDYTTGPYRTDRNWDLCWCCEFIEHIEERFWPNVMATLRECRTVAMTHANPRQRGWHHVNCQRDAYWEAKMRLDFMLDEMATDIARKLSPSPHHFNRSGMIFRRRT